MALFFPESDDFCRITSYNCPVRDILGNDRACSDDGPVTNTLASGENDGSRSNPYISGNMQRRGTVSYTSLMAHRDISAVHLMTASQKQDVFTHQQVVVNDHFPVQ